MLILKTGTRILTPNEIDALCNAITKIDYNTIFNVALYTGMRYVELQRFQKNLNWFIPERKCIYLPKEAQLKTRRIYPDRYVHLPGHAISYINAFFKVRKLPSVVQWSSNLKYWAKKANLDPKGISAKTTRKTWESWLVISYQNKIPLIYMNMGHSNMIAMEHYLQLPFTQQEREEIKNRTAGWME